MHKQNKKGPFTSVVAKEVNVNSEVIDLGSTWHIFGRPQLYGSADLRRRLAQREAGCANRLWESEPKWNMFPVICLGWTGIKGHYLTRFWSCYANI